MFCDLCDSASHPYKKTETFPSCPTGSASWASIAYVALVAGDPRGVVVIAAYTSSQPWRGPRPPGVYEFDQVSAAGMGQRRAFTLDLRRIAALPLTQEWFPRLGQSGRWRHWSRAQAASR